MVATQLCMDSGEIKSWTVDKVEDWVREKFSDDTALACTGTCHLLYLLRAPYDIAIAI